MDKKEANNDLIVIVKQLRKNVLQGSSMVSSGDMFGYVLLGEAIGDIGTILVGLEDGE